jgi:tetratricopeptide (TPR) repeat protein/uncharacterized caspase-like protein
MKPLIFLLLLLAFTGNSQTEKSITPLTFSAAQARSGIIRAVIVGISDYEDPAIRDLRFAHRDAEIFAEYLRSSAGGKVPAENIKLLTNKQATLSAIDDALNWLRDESRAGDMAIIYFSGHGDVEKQTLWQLGYLLTYNTWGNNYRNRAERIEDLNDIVISLSTVKNSRVIVILDACRSGKLASEANRGTVLTAEQMGKRVANEVRIMSCQPDQLSLEEPDFGGGRGIFSYYLVNGLKGLADEEKDQQVTLVEMEEYLKSNVRKAAKLRDPEFKQNPVIEGQPSFMLAQVEEPTLKMAELEMSQAKASEASFASTDKGLKGILEAETLAIQDDPMAAFSMALDKLELTESPGFEQAMRGNQKQILQFFTTAFAAKKVGEKLSKAEYKGLQKFLELGENSRNDPELRAGFSRRIAVQLNDRAQHTINLYLRGDAGELAKRYYETQAQIYARNPLYLKAAMHLIEPSHPLYQRLNLNYLYLDGVGERLLAGMSENPKKGLETALKKQLKALALDDKAPYIHNELGLIYLQMKDYKKARAEFEIAADLAPGWAFPWSNLCIMYTETGQLDQAKASAEQAIALQADYPGVYNNLGDAWAKSHNYLKAETLYRKAISLNDKHFIPFQQLGYLLSATTRFEAAEEMFFQAERLKVGVLNIGTAVDAPGRPYKIKLKNIYADGITNYYTPIKLISEPRTAEDFILIGRINFDRGDFKEAESNFRKVIALAPDHLKVYDYLGQLTFIEKRYEESELFFKKLLKLRPAEPMLLFKLAEIYREQNRWTEEEKIYREVLHHDSLSEKAALEAYQLLIPLLEKERRYLDQERALWEYAQYAKENALEQLDVLYSKMVDQFPTNTEWLYKQGVFYAEREKAEARAVFNFEMVLDLDSSYSARAYLLTRIGEFQQTKRPQKAIKNLQKALEIMPEQTSARYALVTAYLKAMRYDEAFAQLDTLYKNNQIDLSNRLKYADLQALSGNYIAADSMLQKALYIQLDTLPGLHALMGKSAMLNQQPAAAIEAYQKEYALSPGDADLAYTIGRLYARTGQKTEAMEWLRRAFESGFKKELVLKYDREWDAFRESDAWKALWKK